MITALEWAAFCGVLIATWLYGYRDMRGPIAGAAAAVLFVIYGVVADIPAASLTNIIFFGIHVRNAWIQKEARHAP